MIVPITNFNVYRMETARNMISVSMESETQIFYFIFRLLGDDITEK